MKLTEQQKAELQALAAMKDEDIDFSDIPETLDWSNAIRGAFHQLGASSPTPIPLRGRTTIAENGTNDD